MMTLFGLQYAEFVNRLTVKRKGGIDGLLHATIGMSGESGEALDLVKKTWVYAKPLDVDKLKNELGDTLFYLQFACNELGITLRDLAGINTAKLEARYPNGYSDAAAIARKDNIT